MTRIFLTKIEGSQDRNRLESLGNFLEAPGRLFWGRRFQVITKNGQNYLESKGLRFHKMVYTVLKIVTAILLPLSILSVLFGVILKSAAHYRYPNLKLKYSLGSPPIDPPLKVDLGFSKKPVSRQSTLKKPPVPVIARLDAKALERLSNGVVVEKKTPELASTHSSYILKTTETSVDKHLVRMNKARGIIPAE
jgi:hypothetical protein